jgi:hypothetical protein
MGDCMVEKKFCDICGNEFDVLDRTYMIHYGEKTIFGGKSIKGEICLNCLNKIKDFVKILKSKKEVK